MASPGRPRPTRTSTTPEISVTELELDSDELDLPSALPLPKSLPFSLSDSLMMRPKSEKVPIVVIPKGAVESINDDGVCTIPHAAPTQPFTVRAEGVVDTYKNDGELSTSVPIACSPATLKQRPKILSELRRSISTSHLGHLFHHPKVSGTGIPAEKAVVAPHSGAHTPLPDSPDVQELFKKHSKENCPDLDAVNKALTSLRAQSRPGDYEYVTSLTRLATSLEMSRADSKKALIQAMQARDAGRNEVCRSLCLSIVQNSHADVDTRVYSYNILSTLASPGQAMNFLADAYQLVQESQDTHPEYEKLLGVIALLKDGAIEKDGGCISAKAKNANQQLCDLSMPPTIPKEVAHPQPMKKSLDMPHEGMPSGTLTPRGEKILGWATDSKPPKTKGKSLWADLTVRGDL